MWLAPMRWCGALRECLVLSLHCTMLYSKAWDSVSVTTSRCYPDRPTPLQAEGAIPLVPPISPFCDAIRHCFFDKTLFSPSGHSLAQKTKREKPKATKMMRSSKGHVKGISPEKEGRRRTRVELATLKGWPRSYAGLTLRGYGAPDGGPRTLTLPSPLSTAADYGKALARRDGRQELVLLVGFPACGKSTFYRRFFAPLGYVHVNRDTLKTREKCLSVAGAALTAGQSVVVDNTNPSSAARREFTALAPKGAAVRVFVFQHSMEEAQHWNEVRVAAGLLESRIPAVAYFGFRKQFEPYTPERMRQEGVEEVWEVPPVACFDELPSAVEKCFFQLY